MTTQTEQDMEEPEIETQSIVDFANMDFQTGQIIPSATQEEILFSTEIESATLLEELHTNILSLAFFLI